MSLHTLSLGLWALIVDFLPRSDLHNLLLADKSIHDLIHTLEPLVWKSFTLSFTPPRSIGKKKPPSFFSHTYLLKDEQYPPEIMETKIAETMEHIKRPRYRNTSSLALRGTWSDSLLYGVTEWASNRLTELVLDATKYNVVGGGIADSLSKVGKSLTKLVVAYTILGEEPTLPDAIVKHCPNLEHLEIRFPRWVNGIKWEIPIPADLPEKCPKIHTFHWVCHPSQPNKFDLSPIPRMPKLHTLSLVNVPILHNNAFYTHVVEGCPRLKNLSLTLPLTFQNDALRSLAPLAGLQTLELYNCSYSLRPLELEKLTKLMCVRFHNSVYDCDFETIDLLASLPLAQLEVKFQSTLRASQLKDRLLALMSRKSAYRLTCKGYLYDTFCYSLDKGRNGANEGIN